MEQKNCKGFLYLLPAFLFLGFFLIYPLIDVFVYSFQENYNFASQTYTGIGLYNYQYVLRDPHFLQALKNTFLLVVITVPLSTGLALLISLCLSSIQKLRDLFQTVFFLPYVTNTLAVGLVFMILFKKTAYSDGFINLLLNTLGISSVDFLSGPYWAKMLVLCLYTVWIVMPFKILILTSSLASVNEQYRSAARIDGANHFSILFKIVCPLAKAGVATLTMFYGVARWNEYYRSGIYISSISKVPLQVILRKFVVDGDVTTLIGTQNLFDYNALAKLDYTALQYATIIVAIIPILLVYPLVLKFYTKNVMAGGVKE